MNKKMFDALEVCLQRMEHGESLDTVLASYPGLAAQLRPLLETAICARSPQSERLPVNVLARQRSRGLALAADLRQEKNHRPWLRRFWRPVLTFLSVAALLLMSSNGLLLASAHSIPGDTLYPLKRSVESTQLHLVSDPNQRQVLEQAFSERRVEETRSLINTKRVENVEFTGVVSLQSAAQWLVSGIPVVITSQTIIDESILVGDNIEVDGATNTAGDVEAIRLSLFSGPDTDDDYPALTPTPTPSAATVVTETPTEESSISSAESSAPQSQSVEDNSHTGDHDGQSTTDSHDDHSSGETRSTQHPDSEGGDDH
jgi:hypothetical protein